MSKPKHTLISIGWLGCKRVYLDLSLEEAKRRYSEAEGNYASEPNDDQIEMYEIEDEFWAYDIDAGDAPGAREITVPEKSSSKASDDEEAFWRAFDPEEIEGEPCHNCGCTTYRRNNETDELHCTGCSQAAEG